MADPPPGGPVYGDDGRGRCPWGVAPPDYRRYHDTEWGRSVTDERGLFERLSLEAFQSGLSWLTILRKRAAFRSAFADFDPAVVAAYGPGDVDRLIADPAIVRNRAKIEATVANARAVMALSEPLGDLLWRFAPVVAGRHRPATLADVAARTPESDAMARELKRQGFRFVGPTTAHALMQATGMVNDHLAGCWVVSVDDPFG